MNREISFNDPIKEEYYNNIDKERVHVRKNLIHSFIRISNYEDKFGKMIQFFNMDEILLMYKNMLEIEDRTTGTILNTHYGLKLYIDYCIQQKICKDNIFDKITGPQISMLNSKGKNKQLYYDELQEKLALLINPVDKFIILGLFEGIYGKSYSEIGYSTMEKANKEQCEIWLVTIDKSNTMDFQKRKFIASKQLFDYALDSSQIYEYYAQIVSQNYQLKGDKIVKCRINGDEDEESETEIAIKGKVATKINNICKYLNLEHLSPIDIRWAGIYHALTSLQAKLELDTIDEVFKTPQYQQIKENYQLHDRKFVTIDALRKRGYLEK